MKRIGVVGIVVKGNKEVVLEMQRVLSDFSDIIIGRMGVPREEANAIALIVEGSQERVSALTGSHDHFRGGMNFCARGSVTEPEAGGDRKRS